jgi:hypothetical protein
VRVVRGEHDAVDPEVLGVELEERVLALEREPALPARDELLTQLVIFGGLFMGFGDSYFIQSGALLGAGVGNYGTHSAPNGMAASYGFQRNQMFGFQYMGPEGFYAGVAAENNTFHNATGNWMPNVVARAAYAQAWGGVYGVLGYDSFARGWAGRIGLELNVPNAPGSSLRLYSLYRSNYAAQYGPFEWSNNGPVRWNITGSYNHNFGNGFSAGAGATYNHAVGAPGGPNGWVGQIFAAYTPVPNFTISADVSRNFRTDRTAGFLRFQRNF